MDTNNRWWRVEGSNWDLARLAELGQIQILQGHRGFVAHHVVHVGGEYVVAFCISASRAKR